MDDLENLIDALMHLQHALGAMGIPNGAVSIALPPEALDQFDVAVKASPSFLHSLPNALNMETSTRQICGVAIVAHPYR